jgi:hypothetical protein
LQTGPHPTRSSARRVAILVAAACAATPTWLLAQAPPALASDLPADGFIARTGAITLRPTVALPAGHRIALFIDDTDVSALLAQAGDGWHYDAAALPLEAGEHALVAWIVDGDGVWREALEQTFRVPGALGIERVGARPSLDLGLKSRLASAFEPAVPGERGTYNDFDGRLGLETEVTRRGGLRLATRAQVVGNSERDRALRFGELAEAAPRIDLSSYVAQVRSGGMELSVGNLAAGAARHLIQGFNSRGATLSLEAGARVQLSASALHGSNIVGWDDLVGLSEPDHRLITSSLGIEALRQPGALRVEFTALDGSLRPRSGFGRGAITDAETSTGYAVRVQSQALDRRLRLEGGITRSSFDNPMDPSLAQDTVLVPVERTTRDARFLQTSVDVLRNVKLGATRTARMTVGWSHEEVDPLFRTVGAYTRADRLENRWELRGDIAGASISATHGRSRNNLAEIPSILTSHTRRTGFDVALPLTSVLRGPPWLPGLRWRTDRTHQFGAGVPVDGGFAATHVPDQVSTDHTLSAEVRLGFASLGYRVGQSAQDNRQTGRENADLERSTHGLTAALVPLRNLSANLDLSWVGAHSVERDETDRTRGIGVGISWSPLQESVLGVQLSDTRVDNEESGSGRNDRSWSVQWAAPVPGLHRFGAKWLLRFAHAENVARGVAADDVRRENWMVDAGFNLSFR